MIITLNSRLSRQSPSSKKTKPKYSPATPPLNTKSTYLSNINAITLLRDPVQRTKIACQNAHQEHLKINPTTKFNLDRYLNDPLNSHLENLQVKFLVGYKFYEKNKDKPNALVQHAIDILVNKFIAFGITEHYEQSLIIFKNKLNWKNHYYRPLANIKYKNLLAFDSSTMKEIYNKNNIDTQLYERAQRFFNIQINEISDIDTQVSSLKTNSQVSEPYQNPIINVA